LAESFVIDSTGAMAYYLMDNVGKLAKDPLRRDVFLLLFSLHVEGITHGDPRLENIIMHEGRLKWMDMRDMCDHVDVQQVLNDVICVIACCFGVYRERIEENVDLINYIRNEYTNNVTEENMVAVYNRCKEIFD
jgi:tRNA A-37 threonylcarbamoyl transferase component Bud32